MADAGKQLIGVQKVKMGGRVLLGPYAWGSRKLRHAWLWNFTIIKNKGGLDAQLFEVYIVHKYPLVPRKGTITWFELDMLWKSIYKPEWF